MLFIDQTMSKNKIHVQNRLSYHSEAVLLYLMLKKRKIRFPPAPLSSACVFFYIYLCICVYIYIGFFRFYKSEHNRIKPKKPNGLYF